jgi:hypothetical protein
VATSWGNSTWTLVTDAPFSVPTLESICHQTTFFCACPCASSVQAIRAAYGPFPRTEGSSWCVWAIARRSLFRTSNWESPFSNTPRYVAAVA